jgi:hypothetical protein
MTTVNGSDITINSDAAINLLAPDGNITISTGHIGPGRYVTIDTGLLTLSSIGDINMTTSSNININASTLINGSIKVASTFYDNNVSSGTSGQVLTAGTGGQAIWSTITGGSNVFWSGSLTGDISNDNTGNVGIGIATPLALLHIGNPNPQISQVALICEGDIKMGIDTSGPGATYYVRGRNTASATIWYTGNFSGNKTVSFSLLPTGETTTIGNVVAPGGFSGDSYAGAIGITLGPYSYATFTQGVNSYSINNPTPKPVYIGFPFPASPTSAEFTPNFASGSSDTYLLIGNIKA